MTLDDIVNTISDTIKESIGYAIGGVYEKYDARFSDIESQIKSIPKPEKGEKGDSVTIDDIIPVIEQLVGKIEPIKGDKGDSVTIDDVKPIIEESIKSAISEIKQPDISHLEAAVKQAIESIPVVHDGKNGSDGKDGVSPSPDEVAKSMEHIFAKWALDFERKADSVLEKAIDRMPKPRDGRDAIDIDGFELSIGDDDRTVTVSMKRGETVIEKSIKIPTILDRGVFKHGKTYEKGDAVTFGGCLWIAQCNTEKEEPRSDNEAWRLAVKRGRDGKEVVKINKPETVRIGA